MLHNLLRNYRLSIIPIIISIFLCVLSILFHLSSNPTLVNVLHRLEAIPYDIRLKLSTPIQVNNTPPIIIIDIDELSLKTEGRWPWQRNKLSKLIEKLHQSGVAVIGLDFLLSEKEINPAMTVQTIAQSKNKTMPSWFQELKLEMGGDRQFSQSIQGKEVVLGYPFHHKLEIQNGQLHDSSIAKVSSEELKRMTALVMKGYTANLSSFKENSAGSGFFSIIPDLDGSIRRAPLVAIYDNAIYTSLSLELARIYLMEEKASVHIEKIGDVNTITHINLGKSIIPTDAQGKILIPYLGKQKHFTYLSATELLNGNDIFPQLENAIVLIGTSAVGLADLRPTPVQSSFPGVEIHANILHGLLHPDSISYVPDWEDGATVSWIVFLGVIMILLYPLLQPYSLILMGTVLWLLTFSFNYWLWVSQHIHLPIILSLLFVMAVSSIFVIYQLIKENKDRRRIHGMFGQYVPVEHINKLIDAPKAISTDGERREMTVLFSDIRDFTALSEPLSTRELKTFLNLYLTPITEIIFNNEGTIDKYVGDMVMAFWGAPLDNPKHADHAVVSALEMQNKITRMQDAFAHIGISNVAAGIGIHTGNMNVGDMGSDYRRAYTVLGDAVNLGSRLEGLTKFYGVKILTSDDTRKQCPKIVFRYIDYVQVKGKEDAIKIYEPILMLVDLTVEQSIQLETHENAFKYYLSGEWDQAKQLLEQLYKQTSEPLYHLYLDRINSYSETSPDNWSAIYKHQTK